MAFVGRLQRRKHINGSVLVNTLIGMALYAILYLPGVILSVIFVTSEADLFSNRNRTQH